MTLADKFKEKLKQRDLLYTTHHMTIQWALSNTVNNPDGTFSFKRPKPYAESIEQATE